MENAAMIRRPRTISTKLFVVTSLFLIGFLTVMMLLQTSYFESYYTYKKTKNLHEGLTALKQSSQHWEDDPERAILQIADQIPAFEQKHSAFIAVGLTHDSTLVMVSEPQKLIIHQPGETASLESIDSPSTFMKSKNNHLLRVLDDWRRDSNLVHRVVERNETVTFNSEYADASVLNAVTSVVGTDYLLIASTSLQPVGEAAGIAKDFYFYFLLLAATLVTGMTYVFSRMIARPLVRLNQVAERMSQLDFTAASDVQSDDELGSLGKTLNFLSHNLRDTLNQLQEANVKLQEDIMKERRLEQLREQFVASVSHELKTPISLISGYAEGLRDGIVFGERINEYVDVIIEEAGRMEQIVKDMLDLSQLRSGHYQLRTDYFRIDALVATITDRMRRELEKTGVRCETNIPMDEVIGDPFRIGQVMTNLLSNAIRHSPAGGRICITAHRSLTQEGTEELRLELYNQGDAIPDKDLPLIWETFYTADPSHNRELSGSGVGLTVVRSILELHGSTFGVRNVADGVLFYFTLRVAKQIV